MPRWSMRFDRCQRCGTTEREHVGHGYCHRCYYHWFAADHKAEYNRRRRQQDPAKVRAVQKRAEARNVEHYRRYRTEWARDNKCKWAIGRQVSFTLLGVEIFAVVVRTHRGKPWRVDLRLPSGAVLEEQDTRLLTPRFDYPRVEVANA